MPVRSREIHALSTRIQLPVMRKLLSIMDKEKDSLRFYYLGNKYETRVEHFGAKAGYEPEGALIV